MRFVFEINVVEGDHPTGTLQRGEVSTDLKLWLLDYAKRDRDSYLDITGEFDVVQVRDLS